MSPTRSCRRTWSLWPPSPASVCREKFLNADIGITGANFGVAETGTICTVTNEGNARLVTSVPPVHVVVMGIEKVIPKFEDLSDVRAAPVQEWDGAEDHGLHQLHHRPARRRRAGRRGGIPPHPHGQRPLEAARHGVRRGSLLHPLRLVPERLPRLQADRRTRLRLDLLGPDRSRHHAAAKGDKEAKDLPHASSLCGACTETCPVGIPLHDLLLKLRNRQVEEGMAGRRESLMFKGFERTMKSPALYKAGAKVGRLAQKPFVKDGSIEAAPGIRGWTDFRELAPLAEKSFRELWKEGI